MVLEFRMITTYPLRARFWNMSSLYDDRPEDHADAAAGRPPPPAGAATIAASVLMEGRREIVILHAGQRYRLRITANDKLILTK